MGCSIQKDTQECCGKKENHQCDEFYPYYNCPEGPDYGYYYRDYKKHVYRSWRYDEYYPNTQTVYYVYPQENAYITHSTRHSIGGGEVTPQPNITTSSVRKPRAQQSQQNTIVKKRD